MPEDSMDGRRVLDCSTLETAETSLAALYEISAADLAKRLDQFELDSSTPQARDDHVLEWMNRRRSTPEPDTVRWFHATRALPESTFAEGLLPTTAVLPQIWTTVERLASRWITPSQWQSYRVSFDQGDRHFSAQFFRKRVHPDWEGPFGFLVRDSALGRHDCHRDFTRMGEAAADICGDFEQFWGQPMRCALESATRPCLVIFRSAGPYHGAVRAALNYVYHATRHLPCGYSCNTNFDGHGRAVPPSHIEGVCWLPSA